METATRTLTYRYDFLKYRKVAYLASAISLAIGVALLFTQGLVYHIDFAGGTEMRINFEKSIDIATVRGAMRKDASIQEVGTDKRSYLVKLNTTEHGVEQEIVSQLSSAITENNARVDSVEMIGAEVGKDTQANAAKAVALALLVLLLYIAVRTEFRFGVGAITALLHDILTVIVFLVIAREAVSLDILGAVLAMLGYSINDTIVIFSKIRENMKEKKGASEYDIVNLSINQTLRRTILTSAATLLSALSIFFLGGEALRGLAAILVVGIIAGTYSSIYVASAVMLAVGKK